MGLGSDTEGLELGTTCTEGVMTVLADAVENKSENKDAAAAAHLR